MHNKGYEYRKIDKYCDGAGLPLMVFQLWGLITTGAYNRNIQWSSSNLE